MASEPVGRVHGGPDARGAARWDFSTNANACGPCPAALRAIRAADPTRYPDPHYTRLRERLGQWHGVGADRIVVAGSASEFIMRVTCVSAHRQPGAVCVPVHAYADYAAAARAFGRPVVHRPEPGVTLLWQTQPSSPLGQWGAEIDRSLCQGAVWVQDLAYAPLMLNDQPTDWRPVPDSPAFRLFSPNKALGLTGIRGAYALAPPGSEDWVAALQAVAPSWPLGTHAEAMLLAWATTEVHDWLMACREPLRAWKQAQLQLFAELGAVPLPSDTNFFCAPWPPHLNLGRLRQAGVALRDAQSFGLPGHVRASVQPPQAQQALWQACQKMQLQEWQ